MKNKKPNGPRVLVLDLETSLMRFRGWRIGEQYIRHEQIEQDSHLMSWAAKWLGEKTIHYMDQRHARNIKNDRQITKGLWGMLDQADMVIYQNGDSFDQKVANTRFFEHLLKPPSSYRSIDILKINRNKFKFPSNKLDYVTNKYNKKYKKLKHGKFPGEALWLECEKGNMAAWDEMKKYNIYDVLSTEEYYQLLQPWITTIQIYSVDEKCNCGALNWKKNGFRYTNACKYQRLQCGDCGAEVKGNKI